ncbi:P-loop containing nucleoside triphosphate hydrolase protein [Flagelloscypha sp. PMI_526]|nr:P-loop containing nucleoside triphosphate hydrolase protein [Flagelloscypha sp. PMI_526]
MASILWRQFIVLFWKNWIILSKHPLLNFLRCFLLPVGYGIFLAVAQIFLLKPNNYGLGTPAPIQSLSDLFDGSIPLIWADGTTQKTSPSPTDIISRLTAGFSADQLGSIRKLTNPNDIPEQCPQNFNLFSECYAAVAFYDAVPGTRSVNYTILADGGLAYVNVEDHTSDYEKRIMPLQWALDKAIIELSTSQTVSTPQELPFTQDTNEDQDNRIRTSFIRGIRELLVLAFFVNFVGISYQLPGSIAEERSTLLTSHMKAMGLREIARVVSWHLSISLAYLPAWIIVGLTWHYRIWTLSSAGLILGIHILLGFSLASYAMFVCVPFSSRSPQLSAVVSTFITILLSIRWKRSCFHFTLIFPPGYYVFVTRALAGWENHLLAPKISSPDPDSSLRVLPLMIAALIGIFLWPWLAVLLERRLYDAHYATKGPSWIRRIFRRSTKSSPILPDSVPLDTAISIQSLKKTFNTSSLWKRNQKVTAIGDLTLNIPRGGIFVLLGSNGSGKSTIMSLLAGILSPTSGDIVFIDSTGTRHFSKDVNRNGSIGLVPQKNVLIPELTCLQTLKVWRAIKSYGYGKEANEDLEQLLKDCDLESKINENSGLLSGGQKRKLQLAIGLVGGSDILLVDECTSGVDPLSRRALWRTLTSVRDRTIIFTTHFLDEADLLADNIAVLAAPGNLVAEGTPIALKRDLGQGYSVVVSFQEGQLDKVACTSALRDIIHQDAPDVDVIDLGLQVTYKLNSKDHHVVRNVLENIESHKQSLCVSSYDISGSTIEGIFLDLMITHDHPDQVEKDPGTETSIPTEETRSDVASLPRGQKATPFQQAITIFYKRLLIFRRSWLSPLLAVLIAVFGSTVPIVFLDNNVQTCVRKFRTSPTIPLYLPSYALYNGFESDPEAVVEVSPPGILDTLPNVTSVVRSSNLADKQTFMDTIDHIYRNLSFGGLSYDSQSNQVLFAWEAVPPGTNGLAALNLASNMVYHGALNASANAAGSSAVTIQANFQVFPPVSAQTLRALKWVVFFGATFAVYPAFFSLYVSEERKITLVQAMQFSNGLSNPVGLWLGHLAFDTVFTVFSATAITIVLQVASDQFHGLGLLWLVMVLYGITATLWAYCITLITSTPLAAFATTASVQVILFLLYISGYLLTLTYAKTSEASHILDLIHWTMSILSPVCSLLRAAFVSVNLFSLLCDGSSEVTNADLSNVRRFGGPLIYLFIYPLILFGILVWVDSGSVIFSRIKPAAKDQSSSIHDKSESNSQHLLQVSGITKRFGKNMVVDNVSLDVSKDITMALLGPNGAGKTTTFNIIRGDILPETGKVMINGYSVAQHPQSARLSLGICPQFTPIEKQLTVREHLLIYGRLKGLNGTDLRRSVNVLLKATGLDIYAERLARNLSGGNQRKVALCAAIIGNPPVILIDEFSTGIDARMRREMWQTLRTVARGKAIVITTHSMEEASALANKVAIIARKVLAVGTPEELTSRYPSYEVHFTCRTREEVLQARQIMARIPGAKMADDVATRFEVPLTLSSGGETGEPMNLSRLFMALTEDESGSLREYTVEKVGLESVFLKVIRDSQVTEDRPKRRWWWPWS